MDLLYLEIFTLSTCYNKKYKFNNHQSSSGVKTVHLLVKLFDESCACAVSSLICRNFTEVNCRDYPPEEISLLCERHTPEHIVRISKERALLVALDGVSVVGAAALLSEPDGFPHGYGQVTTVFVLPEYHGRGIGKILMEYIEDVAVMSGLTALALEASITAHGFYRKIGFTDVIFENRNVAKDLFCMEKKLSIHHQQLK